MLNVRIENTSVYTLESGFDILIPKKQHRTNSSLRIVSFQIPKPFSDVYINLLKAVFFVV